MRLIQIQPILQNILNMLSTTLSIEGSIIDNEYNLLAYTDNYLKYKGSEVHSPFIKKVMEVGEIIVSQPGHMPICKGCRFQDKCPAKIEILHSILFEGSPVGTISISSFNHADDCLIDKDIKAYAKAVLDTAILIESVLHKQAQIDRMPLYEEMLRTAIDCSPDSILCVNQQGVIMNFNRNASHLFENSDLRDSRFTAILPENRLTRLLNPSFTGRIQTQVRNRRFYVSSRPILWDNIFYGAVIRLSSDMDLEKRSDFPVHYIEFNLDRILGSSPSILTLKDQIRRIAPQDSSVLIIGETGTGKELVARGIHATSLRADHPFVAVNCAAVPETLLESEFFGYDEGAFTGALKKGKSGLIELANGGTLFLDEIGDMPMNLQAKLLRVLQDGELRRLGGEKSTRINVRIVAATNQDLKILVDKGRFRKDLYYRLDVIRLTTPPLRERQADIPFLAGAFLRSFSNRFNSNISTFDPDALALLASYAWPGNVRELENVIEYAVNLEPGETISREILLNKITGDSSDTGATLKEQIDFFEKRLIQDALTRFGTDLGGKRRVAEELDIGLRTLYRKLESLNIEQ